MIYYFCHEFKARILFYTLKTVRKNWTSLLLVEYILFWFISFINYVVFVQPLTFKGNCLLFGYFSFHLSDIKFAAKILEDIYEVNF